MLGSDAHFQLVIAGSRDEDPVLSARQSMQKAYTQLALSSAASRGGGSPRPACHPVSLAPMGGAADDPQILDPPFSTVMSCFAQTLCAFGRIFSTGAVREYAEEVMQ